MTMIQTFPAGGGVGVPSGGTKDQALVKNSNTDKDVTWKTITPGHIIEDSAAAATQRDTVQIKGLSISDDSTNEKTVIEGVGLNSDSLDDITSGSVNNIFVQPSYDYSTTEKIVGKWIDGKPVYQKTLQYTVDVTGWDDSVSYTDWKDISSLNIDKMINISGFVYLDPSSNTPMLRSILYYQSLSLHFGLDYDVHTKYLRIDTCTRHRGSDVYATLLYTKTTD